MKDKHILCSQQFSRESLETTFELARKVRAEYQTTPADFQRLLRGKLMLVVFYEPSTRTRLSFCIAGANLGMIVHGTENAEHFSSTVKGETLEDTVRVLCGYGPKVVVLRHRESGAADVAAKIADDFGVSIINAGDGTGQHPTQSLLDLFTIQDELGTIDGKTVLIGGDLAYGRTTHSLAYLLGKFNGVKLIFVSPPGLGMREDILDHLKRHNIEFREEKSLNKAFGEADVVYWTRIQKERLPDEFAFPELSRMYQIDSSTMGYLKKEAIVMHPLPRVNEITQEVDHDPRAVYFRQASNGLYIRMALLISLFDINI